MLRSPLKRKAQVKDRAKEVARHHFPSHLAWVRGFLCAAHAAGECEGKTEAAHLRSGLPAEFRGGTGQKPDDRFAWPACTKHHAEQHRIGEASFQAKYGLNLLALCEKLAATSPHKKSWMDTGQATERRG